MVRLGPFEASPRIAVAVSGGRDSLALALLADDWVRARGGSLTALIVDHRLRAESQDEANHVATLLRRRGIDTEILTWSDHKPQTGISEAARLARYDLLQDRGRTLGILHLLLGHQADDQAETVLLRLADASGPEGLAGMAGIVERPNLRLLRPLLGFGRDRLAATVLTHGLRWVDDPSNENEDYARVLARQLLQADTGLALRDIAAQSAALRHALDERLAMLAVDLVSADPRGFSWLDRAGFANLPETVARRLLARLASTFGGGHYPARTTGLSRAVALLEEERGAVAGGCRFILRGARILVCREAGAISHSLPIQPGVPMLWDRRYRLALPAGFPTHGTVEKLGPTGRLYALQSGIFALRDLPAPVGEALPGLWREGQLAAVFLPGTATKAAGGGDGRGAGLPATVTACLEAAFRPAQGLGRPAWPLVLPPDEPMYLD
jgi:tRNA(Ile)-lysidine synthase